MRQWLDNPGNENTFLDTGGSFWRSAWNIGNILELVGTSRNLEEQRGHLDNLAEQLGYPRIKYHLFGTSRIYLDKHGHCWNLEDKHG